MTKPEIAMNDRFDLAKSPVLLNGTEVLVRLMLMQKARDVAAGLKRQGTSPAIACRRWVRWICK